MELKLVSSFVTKKYTFSLIVPDGIETCLSATTHKPHPQSLIVPDGIETEIDSTIGDSGVIA